MLTREPQVGTLVAMTLLSFVAIVLLPRQFHVTVVENNSEAEIRRAAWLFPLYLVLINLFVLPIAMAGLLTFPAGGVDSDMFVLALPLVAKSDMFTLLAFVGGLSAATAMVIVETVALAIMVSNDIVVPLGAASGARRCSPAAPTSARCCSRCAAPRSSSSCCSPMSTTAPPARRSSPRSACSPSPRWRSSRRRSSAACSGGAAPRAARSPA